MSVCKADITVSGDGEELIWENNSFLTSFAASGSTSESVNYILPVADATSGGQALLSDASGLLSWGVPTTSAAHDILSGTHSDSTSDAVTRGSLIFGNSTPAWDELVIGAANTFLKSDGTDASWSTLTVSAPITLTGASVGWDSILIDATTWSDGANASNIWTFDVSGTDHTMTQASGTMTFSNNIAAASINLTENTALITVDGTNFLANDGTSNLFLGENAFDNDPGENNVGIGFEAGFNNDTTGSGIEGDSSVYIGNQSGKGDSGVNNTGSANIGIGNRTLWKNTTGDRCVAIGPSALLVNTIGFQNFGMGTLSLSKNTTGNQNTGIGYLTLFSNISNSRCIAIGAQALQNSTANDLVAIGAGALQSNTTGTDNTGIGREVMLYNQQGSDNTAVGFKACGTGAGSAQTSLSKHTAIGSFAGFNLSDTSASDVFLGYSAGRNQTTNSNLLIVDNQDRGSAASETTDALLYGVFNSTVASQSLRINAGTMNFNGGVDNDLVINLIGTTSSGVLTWMKDEDRLDFADSVRVGGLSLSRTITNINIIIPSI